MKQKERRKKEKRKTKSHLKALGTKSKQIESHFLSRHFLLFFASSSSFLFLFSHFFSFCFFLSLPVFSFTPFCYDSSPFLLHSLSDYTLHNPKNLINFKERNDSVSCFFIPSFLLLFLKFFLFSLSFFFFLELIYIQEVINQKANDEVNRSQEERSN